MPTGSEEIGLERDSRSAVLLMHNVEWPIEAFGKKGFHDIVQKLEIPRIKHDPGGIAVAEKDLLWRCKMHGGLCFRQA